jgi:hypothetical protein
MASNEIVPSDDKTVTVQAHTRSAPTPRTNEVTRIIERASLVETADTRITAVERITEYKGKK